MTKIVVFDLDGTLSIVGDRLKYLEENDWDSFYGACGEDTINEPIAMIYRTLISSGCKIYIVTGRRESTREKTLGWLCDNDLYIISDRLFMRKDGDKRHDTIVKPELVANFIGDIEMIFEDRSSMVDEWRKWGLTCLQVAEGNF